MFLFESSKDKEIKKKVEEKYYECMARDGKSDSARALLISYCENSDKVAIERMVDLIKANIKDDEVPVGQKYQSLLLLRDAMRTHNKVLGNYVVKKIMQRLTILAQFKKESTDPMRGKEIFGKRKKPEQETAAKFHTMLLECLMDWGTNWPKNADGPHNAFKQNLQQLLLEKVTMPPVRTSPVVAPRSQQGNTQQMPTREQQLETQRRIQMENQRQIQQQRASNSKTSVPAQRGASIEPQQPTRLFAQATKLQSPNAPSRQPPSQQQSTITSDTHAFLEGVHENFCLLSDMVVEPDPQSTSHDYSVLKEIVKSIEGEMEKGDGIIAQLMDHNDPQSQKAVELITDDFELLDKIKKDIQAIEDKPNKKNLFRDKYVKLLNTRRSKLIDFMQKNNQQQLPRNQPSTSQLVEREPIRQQPARSIPVVREPQLREDHRESNQYSANELPKQPQSGQFVSNGLQHSDSNIPPATIQQSNQSNSIAVGGDAGLGSVRRAQFGQSKQPVQPINSLELPDKILENGGTSSVAAFDKFNQYQPRQSSSEVADFKMFEQRPEQNRGPAEDFFGAKVQSKADPDTVKGPPVELAQHVSPPAEDFFQNQPKTQSNLNKQAEFGFGNLIRGRLQSHITERSNTEEQPTNPFASGRKQPMEVQFESKYNKPATEFQSLPQQPSNPFEESFVRARRQTNPFDTTYNNQQDVSVSNPFEKSSKNLQATNPFEQTVISDKGIANPLDYPNTAKKQKDNPFDSSDSSSQKSNKDKEVFEFAAAFKGKLDPFENVIHKTEPDKPFQKHSEKSEQEFLNIFSKKQYIRNSKNEKKIEDPFNAFQSNIPSKEDHQIDFFNPPRKPGSDFDSKSEKNFPNDFWAAAPSTLNKPTEIMFDQIKPADFHQFIGTNLSANQNIQMSKFPEKFATHSQFQNNPQAVHEFKKFHTSPSGDRQDAAGRQTTPRSNKKDAIEGLLVEEMANIDPTNPQNNPYGNPLKIDEEKIQPDASLKADEMRELNFEDFSVVVVKKIGTPWNPFQRKSQTQSPTKNQLYLKMQLEKLNQTLQHLKISYEEQKELYMSRNRDFLEVRNEYLQKLLKMQHAERQRHDYSRMMTRFEDDITKKQRMIADQNNKIAKLMELKQNKNDCLRKLFECKIKRTMKQSRQNEGGASHGISRAAVNNKFIAFNETAKSLHNLASAIQTPRSFRVQSLRSTLIRTRYS